MSQSTISFVVQASEKEPLPTATYFAVFKGVEVFEGNEKIDGERLRWTWEVVSGVCKGREASALTDNKFTVANKSGRFVSGMTGRALQNGEDLSAVIESCKGKKVMVKVGPGPKGGRVSVQDVSLPPEE